MDLNKTVEIVNGKYLEAFHKYGYSPKSLLWGGELRQTIRFSELLKRFEITEETSILDVGCGFADLYKFCVQRLGVTPNYTGIDYCSEFIKTAESEKNEKCKLIEGNFLTVSNLDHFDYCVLSGIFNSFNDEGYGGGDAENEFLRRVVAKMFSLCKIGISFNFVTDKVDYKKKNVTYYSPAQILDFCYTLSRNILFDNTCMPFEATVTVFKDDSFDENRVFNAFMLGSIYR